MREPCNQILRDPIGEILLLGITAQVVECEHRDRRAALEARDGERIEVGG